MIRRLLAGLLLFGAAPSGAALAQEAVASLALGAVSVRFAEQPTFSAFTLSPSLAFRTSRASAALSGTLAQVADGLSQQGTASFALFSPVSDGGWMGEAGGTVGGSSFPDGAATAQGIASARLHWLGAQLSGWVGGGAGAMYDGARWRSVRQAEVGITIPWEVTQLSVLASPSVTDDTLSYTDFLGMLSSAYGPFDVAASLGGRSGAALPIAGGDQRIWGGLSVTAWLAPRVSFLLGAGTYPVDVTQGFPAGEYVSLSLRVGTPRAMRAVAAASARRIRRTARATGLHSAVLRRVGAEEVELRVRAPDAARVEVTGDLTRWTPVALVRGSDGVWWGRFPSAAAALELMIRLDGGPWLVPPGADEVTDEFGGRSGRMTIRGM